MNESFIVVGSARNTVLSIHALAKDDCHSLLSKCFYCAHHDRA